MTRPPAAARLPQARALAERLHADQRRKDGSTVLAHVLGVTRTLRDVGVEDTDMLVAALLHDALEQTAVAPSEIEAQFGPRVRRLVEALTLAPGATTEESLRQAEAAGDDALLIRFCDRIDGLRRSLGRAPEPARRFRDETRRLYLPLARARFPQVARLLEQALQACER